LHLELATVSRNTDDWRQRATQGAAAEAMCNVESWEARRLTSELDCVRRESEQLQKQLRGTLQHSSSARQETQALECELRSLAQEASAWRHSAEAGASMHARLEAAGWLDCRALTELGSLRTQAQDLKYHLVKTKSVGFGLHCNNIDYLSGIVGPSAVTTAASSAEATPCRIMSEGDGVCAKLNASVRSGILAVHGLHAHADELMQTFQTQAIPRPEAVRKTWHYADQLARLNQRLCENQTIHANVSKAASWENLGDANDDMHDFEVHGDALNCPTWVRVVSQASCAEDRLRALATRLAASE